MRTATLPPGARRGLIALASTATGTLATAAPASAHADEIPLTELPKAWTLTPGLLVLSAIPVALYGHAFVRLRRRGRPDHARPWRAASFLAGLALIVLALESPLDAAEEEYLASAHMLQHMLIADLGAALLIVGLRGPISLFLLPRSLLRRISRGLARRVSHTLLHPAVAFSLWVTAFAAWHVPALYDAALRNPAIHELEHASFIAVGALAWIQLLDPTGRRALGQRLLFFVGILAGGELLALTFLASFRAYYRAYANQDERLFGLSPLTDQRLAGVVMMLEQFLTLGAFLFVTLRRHYADSRSATRVAAVDGSPQRDRRTVRSDGERGSEEL